MTTGTPPPPREKLHITPRRGTPACRVHDHMARTCDCYKDQPPPPPPRETPR